MGKFKEEFKEVSSRELRAGVISKHIGEMLDEIVKANNTPAEDTAHYCNIMILFLREIMINTAYIADHLDKVSIPEFPDNNIKKGVDAVGKHEELNS